MKNKFEPSKAKTFWVKAPWVNAGTWILYILPDGWIYPSAYAYVQTLHSNFYKTHGGIGSGQIKKDTRMLILLNAFVEPSERRKGIGQYILKTCADWIPFIITGASSKISHASLMKFGFKFDKNFNTYYYRKPKT